MMSHELRTPLSMILTMVDILSDEIDGDGSSELYEYLGLINNAGENLAKVCVKDTGIGIPSEKIDQIFQPFIQMNQKSSGSNEGGFGLGLSISKKLARMMGGDLTVRSELGEGSVFTLQVSLADS